MEIGAVTTNLAVGRSGQFRPERQDMMALQQALQSGDLAGAQRAFAQFKQDFHGAHAGHALWQTGVSQTLKQDLQGLDAALKSGDLAGAQQAFAQFKADFKSEHRRPIEPPEPGPSPVMSGTVNVLA